MVNPGADVQTSMLPEPRQPAIKAGWLRALLFFVALVIVLIGLDWLTHQIFVVFGVAEWDFIDQVSSPAMIAAQALSLLVNLLLIYVFLRLLDRKSLVSLGLEMGKVPRGHLLLGVLYGGVLIATIFTTLLLTGAITVAGWQPPDRGTLVMIVVLIIIAAQEELVSRGYLLNNLMASFNKYLALFIVSALFAVDHIGNPNVSIIGLINIVLAGLALGIYYVHRKNLWFPIGLHFGWNFFEGVIFGSRISGLPFKSIITVNPIGNEWLTGGDFGFEASLVTSVVLVIATVLIHLQFRQPKVPVSQAGISQATAS